MASIPRTNVQSVPDADSDSAGDPLDLSCITEGNEIASVLIMPVNADKVEMQGKDTDDWVNIGSGRQLNFHMTNAEGSSFLPSLRGVSGGGSQDVEVIAQEVRW